MGMKDSGIQWIGEIPENWYVKRLRFLCELKTGGTPPDKYGINSDEEGIPWVTAPDMNETYRINSYSQYISGEAVRLCHYTLFPPESILLVCIASVGKIGMIKEYCYSNQQITALISNDNVDATYLLYYIKSISHKFIADASSSVVPIINSNYLKNILVTVPQLKEQKLIADFLDNKVGKIDDILTDLNNQIDILLKYKKSLITETVTKGLNPNVTMKNSEIDYIGAIPENWDVKKLKYLISSPLLYGANESGVDYNPELPRYIRITDITDDNTLKNEGQLSLPMEIAKPFILKDKDILFARSGATVGKTYLYSKEDGLAAFAGYLIKAEINPNLALSKYVYYSTLGIGYENWKNTSFTQATIQNIGADKYSLYRIPLPSLDEQQEIVDFLDEKCAQINAIMKDKHTQIEKMEGYKKSLIYEYVTGKKRVKGVEI